MKDNIFDHFKRSEISNRQRIGELQRDYCTIHSNSNQERGRAFESIGEHWGALGSIGEHLEMLRNGKIGNTVRSF